MGGGLCYYPQPVHSVTMPPATYHAIVAVPFGRLGLLEQQAAVARIDFLPPGEDLLSPATPSLQKAAAALRAWCEDPERPLDFPWIARGTAFQLSVWEGLRAIPRGRTTTYGGLAKSLASAPRAVGQACGANPLPIVIPCHRVVGSRGLGGFMHTQQDFPLMVKRWLLGHERCAD